MDGAGRIEDKVRAAIVDELQRQSEADGALKLRLLDDGIEVVGRIDVDSLVMVVIGSLAGGP